MQWLKQSTAVTVKLGPFVDETDGKTAETALTISQADIRLSKNGAAFTQTGNAAGATHDENGWYGVPLNTTDTNTLGRLVVAIHESGALPVWREFMVVPANMYDSLVLGTDYVQTDAMQIEGSDATNQINAACDTALSDYNSPTHAELQSEINDVQTDIAGLNDLSPAQVNAEVVDVLRTDTIPDSYAADGAHPTIAQAILAIQQFLQERAVSGTTVTVKKPDGSTSAMTFTLDDGTNPTSITRAT